MRNKSMFLYAVIAILMIYLNCSVTRAGENAAYKTAIEQVLEKNKGLFEILKTNKSDEVNEAVKYFTAHTQGLRKIDLAKCPSDFRVAFTNHIHAYEAFTRVMEEAPTGILGTIIYSLVGGYSKIKSSVELIETTWKEVEVKAAKYGVSLEDYSLGE